MIELRLAPRRADPVGFAMIQRGRGTAVREIARRVARGARARRAERRDPVHADRLGREARRLGVAAIGNASVPIFVALLAIPFAPSQRSTGLRLVGRLVGLVGVAILAGVHPSGGCLARRRHARRDPVLDLLRAARTCRPPPMSVGGRCWPRPRRSAGCLLLLPLAPPSPGSRPGLEGARLCRRARRSSAPGSRRSSSTGCSAIHGPSGTALVAYLLPLFALVYGASSSTSRSRRPSSPGSR